LIVATVLIRPDYGRYYYHWTSSAVATPMPPQVGRAATELGEHFAAWRKVLSLTAEQVADRAGISRLTLRKLEHGDPSVGFHVVLRVARTGTARYLDRCARPVEYRSRPGTCGSDQPE